MFLSSLVSVQFSSITQSCPTLTDPIDCSTPGFPVHHQLPEWIQTHVHWVSDTIQLSHPLSSPYSPAFNLSHPQGLFQWDRSSHQVAGQNIGALASTSVLPMNIQGWFPLGWIDWISLQSKALSRVFCNIATGKHQFFGAQPFFMVQLSHPYLTTGKKHNFDHTDLCRQSENSWQRDGNPY